MNEKLPITSRPGSRATLPESALRASTDTLDGMLALEQIAERLSSSTLVPLAYQAVQKKERSNGTQVTQNPSGVANCIIALDIANRLRMPPLMVMQNLFIIDGKPSWSAQMVIASINASGRFSPLQYRVEQRGPRTFKYTTKGRWDNQANRYERIEKTVTVDDFSVVAFATGANGERYEGPAVSMEMAIREGWYDRTDSKWSHPDMAMVMARYRAAAFFGRQYAPELLLGLPIEDEVRDVIDLSPTADGAGWAETERAFAEAQVVTEAAVVDEPVAAAAPSEPAEDKPPRAGKPDTKPPAAATSGDPAMVSEGQQRVIQNALDRKGISAADLCMALGVDSVPMIPKARVNEALGWIDKATKDE